MKKVPYGVEDGIQDTGGGATRDIQLLGHSIGQDSLVGLPAEDLFCCCAGPLLVGRFRALTRGVLSFGVWVLIGQTSHPYSPRGFSSISVTRARHGPPTPPSSPPDQLSACSALEGSTFMWSSRAFTTFLR